MYSGPQVWNICIQVLYTYIIGEWFTSVIYQKHHTYYICITHVIYDDDNDDVNDNDDDEYMKMLLENVLRISLSIIYFSLILFF